MATLRERFEMAVARGETEDARRYAAQLAERHPHLAHHAARAVQASEVGDEQEAWEAAVDARGHW